jgi:hypothetical protein
VNSLFPLDVCGLLTTSPSIDDDRWSRDGTWRQMSPLMLLSLPLLLSVQLLLRLLLS